MAVDDRVSLSIQDALREIERLQRELASGLSEGAAAGGDRIIRELRRGESVRIRLPPPDTSAIPPAIDDAVDRADVNVDLGVRPGSPGEITAAVDNAVDNASPNVDARVDPAAAARITSAVDNAIDAADSTVTVTADVTGTSTIADACEQAKCIDDNLKESTESADGLSGKVRGLVALLVAAGAAKFFQDAISAAADLGESLSKNAVVFAEAAEEVEDWASNAATSMGLATDEALAMASSMGTLFQATGITAAESARLATDLVGLSGDLASFSNVAGGAAAVSEALGAALRGEAEPARALSIILNEEVINRAAVTAGIAAQGEELDAQQKILATYHAIMEQSALAQGDFARTSDGLPNQLRILTAEYRDQQVAIGNELLPSASAFIGLLRDEGLPAMTALAISVVPALVAIFEGFAPLLGTTADIFVAFAPAITAVGEALQLVPGPVLQLIALTAAFYKGLIALQAGFAAARAASVAFSVSGIGVALAAVGALIFVMQGLNETNDDAYQAFVQLRDGIQGTLGAATDAESIIAALADQLEQGVDPEIVEAYRGLGITFDEVARSAVTGANTQEAFNEAITGLQGAEAANAIARLSSENEDLADSLGVAQQAFFDQRGAVEAAAAAQIDLLVVQGLLTQEQADAATATDDASFGTTRYAAALDSLLPLVEQNRAEQAALALEQAAAAGLTEDQANEIRELRAELDPFNAVAELTATQMRALRTELQDGAIDTQRFVELADEMGVSVETLAAAEVEATEQIAESLQAQRDAVQEWFDQLTAQIPGAEQAFADFNEEASVQDALDRFTIESLGFVAQQETLNRLLESGFTDLATFLSTQPPAIIAEFAGATDEELAAFERQIDDTNNILAVGAETAATNAGLLAGNVGQGFVDAGVAAEDADLPGVVDGVISDTADTLAEDSQNNERSQVFREGLGIGVAIGQGVVLGLTTIKPLVILTARLLGRDAAAAVAIGAGVRSPSTLTLSTGRDLASGLMIGAEGGIDDDRLVEVGARAAKAVQRGVDEAWVAAGNVGAGLATRAAAGGGFGPWAYSTPGGGAVYTGAQRYDPAIDVLVSVDGVVARASEVVVKQRNSAKATDRRGSR